MSDEVVETSVIGWCDACEVGCRGEVCWFCGRQLVRTQLVVGQWGRLAEALALDEQLAGRA